MSNNIKKTKENHERKKSPEKPERPRSGYDDRKLMESLNSKVFAIDDGEL